MRVNRISKTVFLVKIVSFGNPKFLLYSNDHQRRQKYVCVERQNRSFAAQFEKRDFKCE